MKNVQFPAFTQKCFKIKKDQPTKLATLGKSFLPGYLCKSIRILAYGLWTLVLCTGSNCLTFTPKISVTTEFHGHSIQTTVDSEIAGELLADIQGKNSISVESKRRITDLIAKYGNRVPSREELKQIAIDFSTDFSAVFFAHQVLREPRNKKIQKQFLKNLEQAKQGIKIQYKSAITVLFVPGFDYKVNGHITGADLANPQRLLQMYGYQTRFVHIDPTGSVEENAQFLHEFLIRNKVSKVILVGASSAGPAIHLALGKLMRKTETSNILAWVNLGGILQGSPLLDYFSFGPNGWIFSSIICFNGWRKSSFQSMYALNSRQRYMTLRLPSHIKVFNYFGLSLSGNISKFAVDKYVMLRPEGPNDGLSLLPDLLYPEGLTILSPHTDHFFAEDPEIDIRTLALLMTVTQFL